MTIVIIVVLCWIFYVAYVDFAVNDAASKGQQYQLAYQQWSGPAAAGDNIAQYRLGEMHEKGLGVPVNPVEAHVWYDLSARGGLDASNAALERLKATMQPAQIEEAERLLVSYANVLVEGDTPSALGPTTVTTESGEGIPQGTSTSSIVSESPQQPAAVTTTVPVTTEPDPTTPTTTLPTASGQVVSDSSAPIVTGTVILDSTTENTAQAVEQLNPPVDPNIAEAIQRAEEATGGTDTTVVQSTNDSTIEPSDESSPNFPTLSVCETQQMLSQLGYSVGTIDGIFGSQTSKAISEYQNSTGLESTGIIDRPLIGSLLSLPWDGASIRSICSRLGA